MLIPGVNSWWGRNCWRECSGWKRVSPPVGMLCNYCHEKISVQDSGVNFLGFKPFHIECFVRLRIGSLGHLEKRCSCYSSFRQRGDHTDNKKLTKRQNAKAVFNVWHLRLNRRFIKDTKRKFR